MHIVIGNICNNGVCFAFLWLYALVRNCVFLSVVLDSMPGASGARTLNMTSPSDYNNLLSDMPSFFSEILFRHLPSIAGSIQIFFIRGIVLLPMS